MNNIDKITAQKIIEKSFEKGRELKLNPLMVVVLDNRGAVKACTAEDGTSPSRFSIAYGKQMEHSRWEWVLELYLIERNNKLISLML